MSVNSSRFFVCKIFSCVVIRTHLFWFSSFFIFPATLGIAIGAPAAVFAGTIQNIQACESEINKTPRNLNSRINSLQRQLACLKNYQANEISNAIATTSTNTQSYQHNLDKDIELGLQYYRGMGVSQNYSKAGILFERAAIAGNPVGQLLLGALYYYGHGVLKDYEIAFGWFRLAALQGDQEARKKIANMYEHGLGVSQDLEKAKFWYKSCGSLGPCVSKDPAERLRDTPDSPSTIKLSRRKELPLESLGSRKERLGSRKEEYVRKNREFTIGYSLGYRYDQFDWNIAGAMNGCCPDVQSELSWQDLHIAQLAIDATGRVNRLYYKGRFGYGAILDGNVQRVLTRHFKIQQATNLSKTQKTLWALAEKLLPINQFDIYSQSIMDLGATICTKSEPNCRLCPINQDCIALKEGLVRSLPKKTESKHKPIKKVCWLIPQNSSGEVLLEKRINKGLWKNGTMHGQGIKIYPNGKK